MNTAGKPKPTLIDEAGRRIVATVQPRWVTLILQSPVIERTLG